MKLRIPAFRGHNPLVEYAIVGAILVIMTLLVMVRLGSHSTGRPHQHCRDISGDSLEVYEACVRREAEGE